MATTTSEHVPNTDTTYVQPSETHTHTMIFLHGREDFGEDLAETFFDSKSVTGKSLAELFPTMKFVFPTAKLRYSAQRDYEFSNSSFAKALKGEEIISQWFDVWDITNGEEKQELMNPGLQESVKQIADTILMEAKNIPMGRIILGGISQGCVTALFTLLATQVPIGGFVGLSSWLPFERKIRGMSSQQAMTPQDFQQIVLNMSEDMASDLAKLASCSRDDECLPPVFLSHSSDDETVPLTLAHGLRDTIQMLLGYDVEYKEYEDGGHWIHQEKGVDDIARFMRRIMKSY